MHDSEGSMAGGVALYCSASVFPVTRNVKFRKNEFQFHDVISIKLELVFMLRCMNEFYVGSFNVSYYLSFTCRNR